MFDLSPAEIEAVLLSLKVSLWAVGVSLPLGIATAWVLARLEFPGKTLLDALIHVPLVVPPVVVGYLLLLLLGRNGYLGGWMYETFGITVAFSWQGAAVAAAVMAFPLMVRAMRLSLEAVDPKLEDAARSLGAPPWAVFATLTLPLSLPGVLTGAILGFAKAMGEFGATITFVSNIPNQTRTIPSAIYTFLQQPDGEQGALILVAVSIFIAILALVLSEILARALSKRIGGRDA